MVGLQGGCPTSAPSGGSWTLLENGFRALLQQWLPCLAHVHCISWRWRPSLKPSRLHIMGLWTAGPQRLTEAACLCCCSILALQGPTDSDTEADEPAPSPAGQLCPPWAKGTPRIASGLLSFVTELLGDVKTTCSLSYTDCSCYPSENIKDIWPVGCLLKYTSLFQN